MIIPVNIIGSGYDIVLLRGAISSINEHLSLDRKVLIVTDSGVPKEYSQAVKNACKEGYIATIPQGEQSKNFENYKYLLSLLIEKQFTRKDCVVAVGGGVIGDLSGFVASTYMRGIDFYNIPTTFLSQVDSSIGGKVAIDFNGIKNVVGAFYQPKKVVIDTNLLFTLSKRQINAGVAESIKMACTHSEKLFNLLEDKAGFSDNIDSIIEQSILIKKAVVEADPTEVGLRKVLNFGHTLGHAIESRFIGEYLHGECVALGMLATCSNAVYVRLKPVLERYNLPTKIKIDKQSVSEFIKHDKKAFDGGISAVYVSSIGEFEFRNMSINELIGGIDKIL